MKNKPDPFPYFLEVGVSLFTSRGEDELHQVLFMLRDCYHRTMEEIVTELLGRMAEEGLRPASEEEFAEHAKRMVEHSQHVEIATKLQDRGTDPEAMRKFLAGYMGREGGDA
jgi:hypothetical protein